MKEHEKVDIFIYIGNIFLLKKNILELLICVYKVWDLGM